MTYLVTFDSLHGILQVLRADMLGHTAAMSRIATAVAGIGALLYIAYRVWKSLADAEAIHVFPLLRPFAIGLCIMLFPTFVIGGLDGILSPIVKGTHALLMDQTFSMKQLQDQKDQLEEEARRRYYDPFYG